jgi:hypothetical protein
VSRARAQRSGGTPYEAEYFPAESADRHHQSIDEALVVGLIAEDPLPRIAPTHDMINSARVLDSQRSAHFPGLTPGRLGLNRRPDLTPPPPMSPLLFKQAEFGSSSPTITLTAYSLGCIIRPAIWSG